MTAPLITMSGIRKVFGPVIANDDISLDIHAGEVLALLGENGAGKSTLMKILYGFYQPDSGSIEIEGSQVVIGSPRDAMARGIGMVFQQVSLIPALSRTGKFAGGAAPGTVAAFAQRPDGGSGAALAHPTGAGTGSAPAGAKPQCRRAATG